jgi:DNA-binding MarR family transcriptional regulator
MTLDYLPSTSIAILKLPNLNLRQKLLFSLVKSFDSNGLKMSNESLGEILDIWPSRVSKLLNDMESKGYVRIDKKRSQYRRIYLLQSATVALATKRNSEGGEVATKRPSTVAQSRNRSKVIREEEVVVSKTAISFSFEDKSFEGITPEDMVRWSAAYPAVDIQGDIRRAAEWLLSNPDKRKHNYRRFLTNWFGRTQEKGGSKTTGDFNDRNRNDKIGRYSAEPNPAARPGEFIR